MFRSSRLVVMGLLGMLLSFAIVDRPILAADNPAEKKGKPTRSKDDYYALFLMLADTMDQIERNYVTKIDRRELMEAAIQGILTKLDPYSDYINPKEINQFRASVENEFGGVGIQISMDDARLTVLSPLVGTPAYRAGIMAGDQIIQIDRKATDDLSLDDVMQRLKGAPGTKVRLTVIRPGSSEKREITITREVIHVETVLGDRRQSDDHWDFVYDTQRKIAYIRLTAFSRDSAGDLKKALEKLTRQDLRGLILDLRFNAGGLLGAAIDIADLFVSKGRIVSTKGRNTTEKVWEAHEEGTFEGFPMVILANRFSASASEIVAACLQDHKRAIIVGERTWGKGSVQNVVELEDGRSLLKLTTASYHRPSGKNIHRFPDAKEGDEWGVMPNEGYLLKLSDAEMLSLVEDRRQRDIITPKGETTAAGKTAAAAKPFVDRQLKMAHDYLIAELARKK